MSQMEVYQGGTSAIQVQQAALQGQNLQQQVAIVQDAMRSVMKEGMHYGTIPGCGNKPVLLKPGAEVIALAFQFATEYTIEVKDFDKGNREYRVTCKLIHRPTGGSVGCGIGSCSTLEKKFNRPNPADMWNTCLKMAKKRAFVDAILTCTAASDCFTQDIEESPQDFGAPKNAFMPYDLHAITDAFGQCPTLETLTACLKAMCIPEGHPQRKEIATIWKQREAEINAQSQTFMDNFLTDEQRKAIMAAYTERGMDRDERIRDVSSIIGRDVGSCSELSKAEANKVLDVLKNTVSI